MWRVGCGASAMITGIRVGKLTICSCGHRLSAVRPWALALLSAAMILFAASRQQALANASAKVDHDRDDDGLIEVADLHQLNAIRYDLDGDGEPSEIDRPDVLPYKDLRYADAFPEALDDMGCPSTGCVGYELTADLNFDTDRDGHIDSDDLFWSEGRGWFPIGWRLKRADWNIETEFTQFPFVAIFEGNGHTVLNLMSKQIEVPETGWFGLTGAKPVGDEYVTGEVRNVGLVSVEVCSEFNDDDSPATGGLIGLNYGLLINSFATGSVCGTNDTGGLVGINYGTVSASYSHAKVSGLQNVGGLVGSNLGNIIASYATGSVTGEDGVDGSVGSHFGTLDAGYSKGQVNGEDAVGGLIGHAGDESAEPTVVHSYWDTDRSKTSDSAGGEGKSTVHLQQPTGYTGIYAGWNVDLSRLYAKFRKSIKAG